MVGYNPETEASLSKQEYAVIGATSSAIARTISQPLDVVKIRFQVTNNIMLVSSPEPSGSQGELIVYTMLLLSSTMFKHLLL